MKATLTEMKNNLQDINSRVKEAKSQISDLEYKEAKHSQSEKQEEKRIQKNEDSIKSSRTTSSIPTFISWGCQKEKRESNNLETYLKK